MSDRERSRRLLIKRTLYASGALFGALFVLLSAQMVLGRDPALGSGRLTAASSQTAQVRRTSGSEHERSIVDRVLSLAQGALGDNGQSSDGGSSPAQTQAQTQQSAPAPVQSSTS